MNITPRCALLSVLLALPSILPAQVIVNEIMYTPGSPEPEWVELYNAGPEPVAVGGWTVQDRTSARPTLPDAIILSEGYLLLTRDSTALRSVRPFDAPVLQLSLPSLNNGGDDVILRDADGNTVDSVSFSSGWGGTGGISLERIGADHPVNQPESWGSSIDSSGGTPGRRNSIAQVELDLRLLRAHFDPDRRDVVVTILNGGSERSFPCTIALYHDADGDATGTPDEQQAGRQLPSLQPDDSLVLALHWNRPLTVSGEAALIVIDHPGEERPQDNSFGLSIRQKFVDTGVVINEIMYTPAGTEPEWIELFNRGDLPVDLKDWRLHDGSSARPRLPSLTLLPGDFVIITGDTGSLRMLYDIPSALIEIDLPAFNNSGDDAVLRNAAGNIVDSLHYFGSWGGETGRSLERKLPTLPSTVPASWETSIDGRGGTPGRENSTRPPERDLTLQTIRFDESGTDIVVDIRNSGTNDAEGGIAVLFHDADNDTIADAEEELVRQPIPLLHPEDSVTLSLSWSRPLRLEGERGIITLLLSEEERPADNIGTIILRQPTVDTGVIINEVMYDPRDPEPEWIEIFNRGEHPVDIGGWRVEDGTGRSPVLPSMILLPGTYGIITGDTTELLRLRTVNSVYTQSSLPAFNNSGDLVLLRNEQNVAVDSLRYRGTWGGRNGRSLERKGFDLPTNDSATWTGTADSSGGTPGRKNSYEPILRDLALSRLTFDPQTASLSGHVLNRGIDSSPPAFVHLYIDRNNNGKGEGEEELEREQIRELSPGDSASFTFLWPRTLLPSGEPGLAAVLLPEDQRPENDLLPFTPSSPRVDTGLIVNEIMYDPNDPEPEWIELLNRGEHPVDLAGWILHDGSGSRPEFPEGLILPNEYIVVTGDTASLRSLRPAPYRLVEIDLPSLNNSGDDVVLRNPSGTVIDSLHYHGSWGGDSGRSLERKLPRLPSDLSSSWQTSTDPEGGTPGKENSTRPPDLDLRLGAITFDPASSEAGAVIYNEGLKPSEPAEAILFHDRNRNGAGEPSEELNRLDVPSVSSYDSLAVTATWPRPLLPEGESGILLISMPGEERSEDNIGTFFPRAPLGTSGVLLNEVMYAPKSPEPEWLELYNADTLPVDLAGWKIGDAAGSRSISSGILRPGEYLVITSDSAALRSIRQVADSVRIIGMALPTLNNGEEEIVLKNGAGATVDSLHYFGSWGGGKGRSLERRHVADRTNDSASWRDSEDSTGATPGRKNSIFPPKRNLGIDSLRFDPVGLSLSFLLYNSGTERAEGASLLLFHDADANGLGESEEELSRSAFPPLASGEHRTLEVGWPRLLIDEGEIALLRIEFPQDEREEDNQVVLTLRRSPPDSGLVITEIMYDPLPVGGESGAEYVEVYNAGSRPVPLTGWSITESSGQQRRIPEDAPSIRPGGYGLIASDSLVYPRFPYLRDSSNVIILGKDLGLNLNGDDVVLRNPDGRTIDSVGYDNDRHWKEIGDTKGISLERIDITGESNDPRNWSSCVVPAGGTPGAPNSRSVPSATGENLLSVLPGTISPDGDGFEDFTRISYHLPAPASRIVVSIYDRHGRRVARPINNEPSGAEGSLIWDGTDDDGRPLPIGIYVVRIESYGEEGTGITGAQQTIVVARRL